MRTDASRLSAAEFAAITSGSPDADETVGVVAGAQPA
jgi:hypothetical protein